MQKEKKSKIYITDRDYEVLKFLWKWKVLSTHAIAKKFYPGIRIFTTYDRLLKLEKNRYVKSLSFRYGKGAAWTLDIQGFNFISPYLLDLKESGFKTGNFIHDFYSTAFHLGEWLTHQPANTHITTEQELRRFQPDMLPSWIPDCRPHRPDGYSTVTSKDKHTIYAFETELTAKSKIRYEKVVNFYDSEESIEAVFWLVGSETIERLIINSFKDYYPIRMAIHNFILLSDFKIYGWKAPIRMGNFKGNNLQNILLDNHGTKVEQSSDGLDIASLLKKQKRPMLPNEYKTAIIPNSID